MIDPYTNLGSDLQSYTVVEQFLREWKSPDPHTTVSVKKIYQVTTPRDVVAKYDAYGQVTKSYLQMCLTNYMQKKTCIGGTWSPRAANIP